MESIIYLASPMSMSSISKWIQLICSVFALQHCYKIPTSQLPSIVHYLLYNAVLWIPFMDNSSTVEIFIAYIISPNGINCVFFLFFWLICYCSWLCRSKPSLLSISSILSLLLSLFLVLSFWWLFQLTLQLFIHSSLASSSTHQPSDSSLISCSSKYFSCCNDNISSLALTLFWATNHHAAKQSANPNQISVIRFCLVIPFIRI